MSTSSRKEFFINTGKVLTAATVIPPFEQALKNLGRLLPDTPESERKLEAKEKPTTGYLYGFAKVEIPARLSPSRDAERIIHPGFFYAYKPGALLRCQPIGGKDDEGVAWGRIIHDQRPAPYSKRAIGHKTIYIPLNDLDPLTPDQLTPIHPEVDPAKKWIEIVLEKQKLIAYEDKTPVLEALVSTGRPINPTPKGTFRIFRVRLARRMAGIDGNIPWDLPGVPFCMYFGPNGECPHGTYWHNVFGPQDEDGDGYDDDSCGRSHGCVNLRTPDAQLLFRWINPQMANPFWEDELRITSVKDPAWKMATRIVIK